MQRFYVLTSNQLKRLNTVATSPLYTHFGESITGASSIRAYGLQEEFCEESVKKIDAMQRARFPAIVANRFVKQTRIVCEIIIIQKKNADYPTEHTVYDLERFRIQNNRIGSPAPHPIAPHQCNYICYSLVSGKRT